MAAIRGVSARCRRLLGHHGIIALTGYCGFQLGRISGRREVLGYSRYATTAEEPQQVNRNTEVDHGVAVAIATIYGGALLAIPVTGVTPLLVACAGVGLAAVRAATKRIEKVERRRKTRR